MSKALCEEELTDFQAQERIVCGQWATECRSSDRRMAKLIGELEEFSHNEGIDLDDLAEKASASFGAHTEPASDAELKEIAEVEARAFRD